jgi:hypothetical protein
MRATARPAAPTLDLAPWLALQRWLEGAEHRVAVSCAAEPAERIPPVAVRLRWDLGQLLALSRAQAILHQARRERDGEGRVVAALEDCAAVRELVVEVIAEGIEATVPPAVRETVSEVGRLLADGRAEVGLREAAQALGLDNSAASRRIAAAVPLGHPRDLGDRRAGPARVCVGHPMPNEITVLPEPEVLRCCWGNLSRIPVTACTGSMRGAISHGRRRPGEARAPNRPQAGKRLAGRSKRSGRPGSGTKPKCSQKAAAASSFASTMIPATASTALAWATFRQASARRIEPGPCFWKSESTARRPIRATGTGYRASLRARASGRSAQLTLPALRVRKPARRPGSCSAVATKVRATFRRMSCEA